MSELISIKDADAQIAKIEINITFALPKKKLRSNTTTIHQ